MLKPINVDGAKTIDMASFSQRHKSFSEAEIKQKKEESIPKSTLKCDKKWTKDFIEYLMEKDVENTEFLTYPEDELDDILS